MASNASRRSTCCSASSANKSCAKKHLSGDAHGYLDELKKYLFNDVGGSDDYLKLKVFSSKGDRLPTYRVAFGSDDESENSLASNRSSDVRAWTRTASMPSRSTPSRNSKRIFRTCRPCGNWPKSLLNCLKIVWIPLDEQKDDAQAIFESLNDKGMPLTASELLCNYLFRPIMEAKENSEELHNNQWLAGIRLLDRRRPLRGVPSPSVLHRRDEDGGQAPEGLRPLQREESQPDVRSRQSSILRTFFCGDHALPNDHRPTFLSAQE